MWSLEDGAVDEYGTVDEEPEFEAGDDEDEDV